MKKLYWWPNMKLDIATYVIKCLTCAKVKAEHQRPSGLLVQLAMPEWKLDNITMDFITKLPKSSHGFDTIWVIMDRLTKSAHFLPIRENDPLDKLAGVPDRISEYEHCVSSIKRRRADEDYSNSRGHATGDGPKVREAQLKWSEMIQETTEKIVLIKQRIQASQDRKKSYVDLKRKPMEFEVGDRVMLKFTGSLGEVLSSHSEPTSYKVAMLELESDKWLDVMNAEIQSMIDNMWKIIRDLERLDIELCVRGQNGFWASLRVEPNLISQIKTAQKDDGEIWAIIQNIDQQTEFRVDDDGILWQGTKLCVPEDPTLREALMTEAHSSPFSIHPGSTKMYHDLKQHFWWSGMKRDVATFVSKCLTCQQVKIEHQRASGLLQPLEIPVWKWDEISMDFVTGLPRTQRKHDAIWVVVDRLTKSAHFLPIRKDYPVSKLAEMFQQEIVRLHGTPSAIVSDRDPRFTSRFWKGLQKAWGTRLKFSTAFHPETDGQSERTIQTLEDMLRSCALEWAGNWDDYICLVEFAYNNSWHASIKCAPFEMLYGRKCRAPICWDQVGERILEGPEMIEVTNEKVAVAREKLKEAQTRQKSYADRHRRALEFQPGEHVFLKVSPTRGVRRFGIKGKLSPRFIGPFEILDRVGEVSYRLALPPQLSHVHNVFHVSLLRGYKYHPLHVVSYPFDQIREDLSYTEEPESILDRQDRVMRNKTIPFVKILWRNHPEREATWETEESIRTSYPHFLP
ncbi:putative nucleotidyltransferase, ribonuclease H [Tanacetum coccineum]